MIISHQEGSPWFDIYEKYKANIPKSVVVEKKDTKKWFRSIVDVSDEEYHESKN